jgi:tetratricopeptide (TPR) repeat protein
MPSQDQQVMAARAAQASANLRREAERSIQKGRYKDAVKQAKMSYKEQATPENHRLLERAYFLRARQLLQLGMRESAVEVAGHLLEFGVTGTESLEEVVRLLLSLGLEQPAFALQERLGSPETRGGLSEFAADQLVIHPERAAAAAPELARDAQLVRRALEQLQARDEVGALERLRDLARSSPLSEWKFFVRGLAAFYRGDAAESQANWDRLDPKRTAAAVARRLPRLAPDGSGTDAKNLEGMEKLVFGEPILEQLQRMRSLLADQDWDKILRLLGPLRHGLERVDPKLAERLTMLLIGSLVKTAEDLHWKEAHRLVTQFTRAAQPLAIDPRWNRLWGILWDGPQGDASEAAPHWIAFAQDLETVAALNPAERSLARALVWNHVAELHRAEVEELSDDDNPFGFSLPRLGRGDGDDEKARAAARKAVVDALEQSLKLAPQHLPTYRLLVEAYHDWGDDAHLVAAARRLLAAFPEDGETHQLLARHYFERSDPAAALPHAQEARRLKPLDESLRELEWMIRIGLGRNYALSQRWDEGRAEFAAAEGLLPDCRQNYTHLARKAAFELKAGQTDRSDQYVRDAQALVVEPAPLWLALEIESIRYKLPKDTIASYTQLWEAGLKKKVRSETAGEMAGHMLAFLAAKIDYPGREEHLKKVVAYLKRGTRVKYRREDIEKVVELLGNLPKADHDLLEKRVNLGLKQHPQSVLLNVRKGMLELPKGTFFGNGVGPAQRHLETALKLAEASTDPKETALLPTIRTQLSLLKEMSERLGGLGGFFGGPFGPSPFGGLDFDDFDDFGLDDDEDFDDEDFFPSPAPARRRAKKRASRKKR